MSYNLAIIKTVIGYAATGSDFFDRPRLTDDIWRIIKSGANILITAPRRAGKTSFLLHLKDRPQEKYRLLYLITESVNSENEFYRKLYAHIFALLDGTGKFSTALKSIAGKARVTKISMDGIELEGKDINYYEALIKLFEILDLKGERLIIMIDEFAETIENIIVDESKTSAVRFLQKNRDLRFNPAIRNKVQFIYAGSIGLENVAGKINASSAINDLYSFKLPPFTKKEVKSLIYDQILDNSEMAIENGNVKAMFNLALLYFQLKNKKAKALSLIKKAPKLKKHHSYLAVLVLVLLWNDEIEAAINIFRDELYHEDVLIELSDEIILLLNMLIAKKQYNFVYKLFNENKYDLIEKYKPIYYALLGFMGEKYGTERKRMGPELEETVEEITETIKRYEKEYA